MGFFDYIKGKSNKDWKKTLVKDLVMLTAVDGDMDDNEIKLVHSIAINELGFNEKDLVSLLNNLGSVKNIYPTDDKEKFEYITTLIRMTYSDGILDDNEIEYMKIIASKMGLPRDGIKKAISIIEKSSNKKINDDEYDDSSIGKILITSPYNPTIDIQTENGLTNYLKEISSFTLLELSIELSNIMAAKYNKMSTPLGSGTFSENQKIVTDLTDKALFLCFITFGKDKVLNYCNQETRIFNQLINDIDQEVATLHLSPAPHGKEIFDRIHQRIELI